MKNDIAARSKRLRTARDQALDNLIEDTLDLVATRRLEDRNADNAVTERVVKHAAEFVRANTALADWRHKHESVDLSELFGTDYGDDGEERVVEHTVDKGRHGLHH